eukprot:1153701-Pelagomonas_calceolata.AAC.2
MFMMCSVFQSSAPLVRSAQQSFKTSTAHPCMCKRKHETSVALHRLSILQTVVTRLQTPYQRSQSPSGFRLIPSPTGFTGKKKASGQHGRHMKRLYMMNGRQARSHLRGRAKQKEGRAKEQGSIFMPERTDLGGEFLCLRGILFPFFLLPRGLNSKTSLIITGVPFQLGT